jgi:hypothetical protein
VALKLLPGEPSDSFSHGWCPVASNRHAIVNSVASFDLGRLVQMVAPHIAAALHTARERARSLQQQAAPVRDLKLVALRRG